MSAVWAAEVPPATVRATLSWRVTPMENDRTAWIFVAFMVVTFALFAAGVIALAFWDFN